MSDEKVESNLSKCSICQEIKPRIQDGYFPDGRNKKYVDEHGNPYIGRKCPDCVKGMMKKNMSSLRSGRKEARELAKKAKE